MLEWLKPKTASLEELEQQFVAATRARDAAQAATDSAQDIFDALGDDAAAKALTKAREAHALANEHYGRAERLVLAARASRAAEERAALEARLRVVCAALSGDELRRVRSEVVTPIVAAITHAAATFASSAAAEDKVRDLERERTRLEVALGLKRTETSEARRIASRSLLCDALTAETMARAHDDPARQFIESVASALDNAAWL